MVFKLIRKRFRDDERGAVTVDWVVLTAALVGMVIGVFDILQRSVYEDAAAGIGQSAIEAAQRP